MDFPNTKSKSSATLSSGSVQDYGNSPDRITNTGKSGEYGDKPIRETAEVKYKEYENDKRMTSDFGSGPANGDFDGTNTIMPEGEPAKSFVVTNFSKR